MIQSYFEQPIEERKDCDVMLSAFEISFGAAFQELEKKKYNVQNGK